MALAHWQRTFTDTAGNVQPSLSVEIRNESTGALAAIYSDSAGTTPKNNPFTTDSFGYGDFYAADGRYRIIATGIDWRNEEVLTFENLQAAVDDAETFAQAAALNAGVYDDTAAGLAATSDGDYFSTPSPAGDEYLILYRNDAGVATEIDTYPNRTAVDNLEIAVDLRVQRVSSRAEMKGYDVPAGYQFSLEEGGFGGLWAVKSGTPPSDPQEENFVVLDNGNYAERIESRLLVESSVVRTPDKAPNDHMLIQGRNGPVRTHMEPADVVESGTVSKLDWMLDPYDGTDKYADSDVSYRIFNIFTKTGDVSGLNGENGAAIIGTKNRGDGNTWGVFTSMHFGFTDGASVPMKMYYFDTSDTEWRTPQRGFWYEGKSLTTGDYLLYDGRLYQAATTGTTGSTAPTHTSGTVSDGGVDLTFIRNYKDYIADIAPTVIFGDLSSMPKFGHPDNPVQFAKEPLFWAGNRVKHLSASRGTGFGLVKSGVRTDAEAWQLEFWNNNRFRVYENRYYTSGIVKTYDETPTLDDTAITSGVLTVPSGLEQVQINLASPATISEVDGLTPWQHITIIDLAGNLTFQQGTLIKTKSGTDLTLSAGSGQTFAVSAGGTLIREI